MKRNTNAKVKPENKKKSEKAWRFYRSNLSTIVWDPDKEEAMADFSKGHFTTTDKRVVKTLRELGYIEIGLKDTQPPNIIVNQSAYALKEGQNVPIMGNGINENLAQKRMDNITEEIQAPEVVA